MEQKKRRLTESEKKSEKNVEAKLEHLGKLEKYLFSLNESFRQDKDEVKQRLTTREQR